MIKPGELRLGNFVLFKDGPKIRTVSVEFSHFVQMEKDAAAFYPVILKQDLLQKAGFEENKDYPLYPQSREFRLLLAIEGSGKHELLAYIKANGECFFRYHVNSIPASSPLYHLHHLQNLYFMLTGKEMGIKI